MRYSCPAERHYWPHQTRHLAMEPLSHSTAERGGARPKRATSEPKPPRPRGSLRFPSLPTPPVVRTSHRNVLFLEPAVNRGQKGPSGVRTKLVPSHFHMIDAAASENAPGLLLLPSTNCPLSDIRSAPTTSGAYLPGSLSLFSTFYWISSDIRMALVPGSDFCHWQWPSDNLEPDRNR